MHERILNVTSDYDECYYGMADCKSDQRCVNSPPGSFTCECLRGYIMEVGKLANMEQLFVDNDYTIEWTNIRLMALNSFI